MPAPKIIKYPDERLLKPSTDATPDEAMQIARQLLEAIASVTWGVCSGMAAPQIGINKRVFVVLDELYINPVVTPLKKGGIRMFKEGCYSLTDNKFDYRVVRSNAAHVTWTDAEGVKHSKNFRGFKAQILQHEYDHLQGKLCNGKNHEAE